jgi:hypothetical protein
MAFGDPPDDPQRMRTLMRLLEVDEARALQLLADADNYIRTLGKDWPRWKLDWVFDALQCSGWLRVIGGFFRIHHAGRPDHIFGPYRPKSARQKTDISPGQWKSIRRQVIDRDGDICTYCGEIADPICVDHIVPLELDGRSVLDNLCVSCKPCNSSKGIKVVDQWKAQREAQNV